MASEESTGSTDSKYNKLFCVCIREPSKQLEWILLNVGERSEDFKSVVHPNSDASLLDATLKLIKAIQEANAKQSCVITTANHIELIAKELKENSIQLPPYIETYANLYSEYKNWLHTNTKSPRDPQTLAELHDALGIKEGEEILENVENIAKAASKLLDNGHLFQAKDKNSVVKDIMVGISGKREKRRVEPNSPVPFQELRTKLVGGISNEVGNSNEGGSGVVSVRRDVNNLDDKINAGTIRGQFVVRLRGLPWQITKEDIEQFFSGLVIIPNGIYFIRDSSGRPMGEGFVRFENQSDFEEAIKRHKHFIGKRYIEVFSSSMDEWNKSGANYLTKGSSTFSDRSETRYDSRSKAKESYPASSGGSYVIRMRGLPYSVQIDNVLDFFRGVDIRDNQVYLLINHSGRITGDGYVCVNSARQAERAMSFHNSRIAQRYIELFKSDEKELDSVLARSDYLRPRDYGGSRSRDRERGRYSPYREPERSRPYPPHREYDYRNYPPSMPSRPPSHSSPAYPPTPISFALRLRGLPYSVTERDIEQFFDGCEIQRDGIHLVRNHQGKLTGEAYVEFHSDNDKRIALRKHNNRIGSRYIELFHATEEEMARYVPRSFSKPMYGSGSASEIDPGLVRMLQGGVGQRSYDPPAPHSYPPPYGDPYTQPPRYGYSPSGQGYPPPGSYSSAPSYQDPSVVIRGLNAHVTVADIQRYFEGYQFNPDSIQVVSNMERTVFEATVQFHSLNEAHRALKEKERGMIGPCAVKLYDQ